MQSKSGGTLGLGIKIGTELVTSDSSISSSFDGQDALRRDATSEPLGDGLGGHADAAGELGLRNSPNLQERFKGSVVHLSDFIHSRFSSVNRHLIEGGGAEDDDRRMVDTPKPEHYLDFKTWLKAALAARGLQQNEFASVAGASPQAVGKWLRGGKIAEERIQKIATWAGCDYVTLRMLIDGKISEMKRRAADVTKTPNWRVQRIAQKAGMLAGDDAALTAAEAVLDSFIDQHAKAKKPA